MQKVWFFSFLVKGYVPQKVFLISCDLFGGLANLTLFFFSENGSFKISKRLLKSDKSLFSTKLSIASSTK